MTTDEPTTTPAALPPVRSEPLLDLGAALAETHRHIEAMYAQQEFDSAEIKRASNRAQDLTAEIIRRSNAPLERLARSDNTLGGVVGVSESKGETR